MVTLEQYLSIGFRLVPIIPGAKGPLEKNWNVPGGAVSTPEQLQQYKVEDLNWGLHHVDSGTCTIDIDDYESAWDILHEQGVNLDHHLAYGVQIDSGNPGHAKLIYRVPFWLDPLRSVQLWTTGDDGKKKASINFRCATKDGQHSVQDLLPPSRHPSGSFYQWKNGGPEDIKILSDELLQVWQDQLKQKERKPSTEPEPVEGLVYEPVDQSRITEALSFVSPDSERDVWLNCGMAVHDALGEAGFTAWAEWSRQGTKYAGERDLEAVWRSIHEEPNGVTYKTLYMYAKRGGWKPTPTWAEIQQSLEKEEAGEDPAPTGTSPERLLADQCLQAVEEILPASSADPDAIVNLQKILLDAEQIGNPAFQLPIHQKIKDGMKWTQKTLDAHLTYVRARAREVMTDKTDGPNFKYLTSAGQPRDHTENLVAICEYYGITIRHNLMSHDLEIADPTVPWWLEDDKANLQYTHIRNLCVQHGMPCARTDEHISVIGSRNSYHPMVEYLKDLQWDGRDWFTMVADTVTAVDRSLWHLTFMRWVLSVCATVRGMTHNRPARGVLVMSGEQWIGKTTWFRYLTPKREMFGEGVQLNPTHKDSVKIATNKVIVELGELDRTFTKADISSLKAFISTPYDEMRLPYAHKESKWPRRTLFCGTVNNPDFLRDPTGNTRFWCNEVTAVDLDTMEKLHTSGTIGQFWAQVNYWLEQGERWWLEKNEMMAIENHNGRYLDYTMIDELLLEHFAWPDISIEHKVGPKKLHDLDVLPINPMTLMEIAAFIGLNIHNINNNQIRDMRASLKRMTGMSNTSRTRAWKWDASVNKRASESVRGRWYFMPYPRESTRVAKVLPSGLAVVQGSRPPLQINQDNTRQRGMR